MTIPRSCYRIMLRRKSVHANEFLEGQFVGSYWGMGLDLTGKLPKNGRDFAKHYNPIFAERYQVSYKISNN